MLDDGIGPSSDVTEAQREIEGEEVLEAADLQTCRFEQLIMWRRAS